MVMNLLKHWLGKPRSVAGDVSVGRSDVNKPFVIETLIALIAMAAAAGYGALHGGGLIALAFAAFALTMSVLTATCLFFDYSVDWDDKGVAGPTSLYFPPLGPKQTVVYWPDIEEFSGNAKSNGWKLKARDGRVIRWNWTYTGYNGLIQAVAQNRPDLMPRA